MTPDERVESLRNRSQTIDLSLVIPLYRETEHIASSLAEVHRTLSASRLTFEVILYDDASPDDTVTIVEREIAKYPAMRLLRHERNEGRGRTVVDGFRQAKGRGVGYIDADLEVSPVYIPRFTQVILDGEADAVTGERIYQTSLRSWSRYLSNVTYRSLVRFFLRLPYRDTETGYKFFRRDAVLPLLDRTDDPGWFWDTQVMAYCFAAGLRVRELPVLFLRRYDKTSTVRLLPDSVAYLKKLIAFSRRWRRERSGLLV